MNWIALLPNLLGAIATVSAGIFAWLYLREQGETKARQQLQLLNKDIISAYEQRVRLLEIQVESLQRELDVARATLGEMRRQRDLIG